MRKRRNIRIFFITLGITAGIGGLSMYSCEKEIITPNSTTVNQSKTTRPLEGYCGDVMQKSIIFNSNNEEVGQALVYNDTRYFYMEINSWSDYLIEDAYLFIGTDRDQIPLDKFNNPDPSAYTQKIEGKPLNNIRKFRIPLTNIPAQSILSCAIEMREPKNKGVATGEDYAWIDGFFIGASIRGRYFGYDKQICRTIQGESLSE